MRFLRFRPLPWLPLHHHVLLGSTDPAAVLLEEAVDADRGERFRVSAEPRAKAGCVLGPIISGSVAFEEAQLSIEILTSCPRSRRGART